MQMSWWFHSIPSRQASTSYEVALLAILIEREWEKTLLLCDLWRRYPAGKAGKKDGPVFRVLVWYLGDQASISPCITDFLCDLELIT